jgi:hypothetical protein
MVKIVQKVSGNLHEDLSTFMRLTAVRNILKLDNGAKGTHSRFLDDNTQCFYIADSYIKFNNNTNGTHCCD